MASWFASLLVHGAILLLLSATLGAGRGGKVSVLDVQVIEGSDQERASRPVRPKGARAALPARPEEARHSEETASGSGTRQAGNPALRAAYMNDLRAAIESVKTYPAIARAKKQEGRVEVAFTLRRDGSISDISVIHSSSFSLLDQAGTDTLARLSRFRPIPDDVSLEDLKFVLPLEFRLED